MDRQELLKHLNDMWIYDRPSIRLRKVAFTLPAGAELGIVLKKRVSGTSRSGRRTTNLFYKVQARDGRVGWIGPLFPLPEKQA